MEGFITAGLSLGKVLGRKEKARPAQSSHAGAIRSDSYKCARQWADVWGVKSVWLLSAEVEGSRLERLCAQISSLGCAGVYRVLSALVTIKLFFKLAQAWPKGTQAAAGRIGGPAPSLTSPRKLSLAFAQARERRARLLCPRVVALCCLGEGWQEDSTVQGSYRGVKMP